MTGAVIAQLLIALGPSALQLIQALAANWNKEMTDAEINTALAPLANTYEQYIAWAKAQLGKP